jgi:putative endonuclease
VVSEKLLAGSIGEQVAALFLKLQGYEIIARNVRTKRSEIDIVAKRTGCLVFVEVKLRASAGISDPGECLDRRKRQRLTKGALSFLQNYPENLYRTVRLDVITVTRSRNELVIRHIENAFPAEGLSAW